MVSAVVGACASRPPGDLAGVEIRGTDPGTSPGATAPGTVTPVVPPVASTPAVPDASGVISYDGYQAAIARDGDTVADVAARVGVSATELGAYNGLSASHALRAGDELVLPAAPSGGLPQIGGAPLEAQPLDGGGIETAAAGTTGWSPAVAAAAIDRATGLQPDGTLAAPPSANSPVPPAPTPPDPLSSPDLGQYQTGAANNQVVDPQVAAAAPQISPPSNTDGLRLLRPVEGPVALGFNQGAGPNRNDGVDFASPAGAPVIVSADGTVALVSQSLGGLGTIVLVRHAKGLLTVYGRLDEVTVEKGDPVRAGQRIGQVASPPSGEPRMHFEVRDGPESLDPMLFL